MTERKFKSYTLWMKWRNWGWNPHATCLNLPYPSINPIDVLKKIMESYWSGYWKRGRTWMILPDDRKPKGAE